MAIDFPNSPAPGDNFTVNGKTWSYTDGKWALNVGVGGVQGPTGPTGSTGPTGVTGDTGIVIQGTAPTATSILWADTSETGSAGIPVGGTTGQVLAKTSSSNYVVEWATPVTSGDMALKADLASPTFTGTPTLPTGTIATTQTAGTSSTAVATTAFVGTAVANLVDSAPATLNTLDELALALGDDANFATTTATAIGLKAPIASPTFTGIPTAPTASVGTNTTQLATTEFVQVANPTGAVIAFAGSSAPSGWLLCFGQTVSRTTYATLFAVLSTTYNTGGEAGTDFRLPDLRGRTVAGVDNMGGTDAGRLDIANSSGTVVGSQYVTLTSAESGVPAHSHANTASFAGTAAGHGHSFTPRYGGSAAVGINMDVSGFGSPYGLGGGYVEAATLTPAGSVTVSNQPNTAANAASAHNNMQPTMVLNYIIKA